MGSVLGRDPSSIQVCLCITLLTGETQVVLVHIWTCRNFSSTLNTVKFESNTKLLSDEELSCSSNPQNLPV